MKKFTGCLVVVLLVAFSTSIYAFIGSDNVEETRQLKGFERISLQGSPKIKYVQGKSWSVRVKAPKKVISDVQTRIDGNCLIVSMKRQGWFRMHLFNDDDVTVYVTSPDLIGVEVHGSGDFESKSRIDTDNLDVCLKGAGDIELYDVICDRVNVSMVGSGDVSLRKVTAQFSSVELVGSGDVKINQQHVKETQLELRGSGDITMNCQQCGSVSCHLVGSGDITLSGTVRHFRQTTRGSGDVNTQGLKVM